MGNHWAGRRWLLLCNPALSDAIAELDQLCMLKPLATDKRFRDAFLKAKRAAKAQFADYVKANTGHVVRPARSPTRSRPPATKSAAPAT